MAKKPTTKAPSADKTYKVELAKAIRVGRRQVLPGSGVKLRGDVLATVLAEDETAVVSWME